MKRAAVFLVCLALFTLLSEGVLSLGFERSWRQLFIRRSFLERLMDEEPAREIAPAATLSAGPFGASNDPLVGNTFRVDSEVDYLGQRFRTDDLGLRMRPAGTPGPDAFRLVFVGDSVTFGHGLALEHTLASQVERILREARAPGATEVACLTVAVPGWNAGNSLRHLLDHLDRIAPDLVLFLPVQNDLDDTFSVKEDGQRGRLGDPASSHPLFYFAQPLELFRRAAKEALPAVGRKGLKQARLGPGVIEAGLSHCSRTRLEGLVALLLRCHERLARIGAELVLVPYIQHDLHRVVRARLLERGVDLPVIPLLDELTRSDGQESDPHPSEETTRAMALWIAASLLEDQRVPGAAVHDLPEVGSTWAGRRARELAAAELPAWRSEFERGVERALEPQVFPELRGLLQVYGGVNEDGSLGIECAVLLPAGRTLRVELAGAVASPGLYPLAVGVLVNERELGDVVLEHLSDVPSAREFPLSPDEARAPFELRLVARDWVLHEIGGHLLPVSAKIVRLESLPQ